MPDATMASSTLTSGGPGRVAVSDSETRYADFRSTSQFGSLDGLRCASIILVIWQHVGGYLFSDVPWLSLLTRGYLGVELFFVISGFLITTLLLRERDAYGAISLPRFYMRRTLRILPLYYLVLGVYVALVWMLERDTGAGRLFFRNLPYYATYTSNWFVDLIINEDGQRRVIFIFAWSLATEEQFYLVWPFVLRYLGRGWPVAVLLATVAVDQAASFTEPAMSGWVGFRATVILTSISTAICLGVMLAMTLHEARGHAWLWPILGRSWSSPIALFLLLVFLSLPIADGPAARLVTQLLMVMLVGACVAREDHGLARILRWSVFRRIGRVSYGMYMLHMLCIHVVDLVLLRLGLMLPLLRLCLAVMLTYLAAALSYRYYESWFLQLKDRWRRGERGVEAAAGLDGGALAETSPSRA